MVDYTGTKGIHVPLEEDPNNVPSDSTALAAWLDAHPGIEAVTTTERNALVAPDLWPGMIVFNETTGHLEQNTTGTAGSSYWSPVQIDPAGIADRSLPAVKLIVASVTDAEVAAANKDGAAGTPSMRTLGTGAQQAAPGNDSRFANDRRPSGAASGDLTGTYPNPTIAAGAVTGPKLASGSVDDTKVATANKDGAAGTVGMRTLGTGAQQAAPGNHNHDAGWTAYTPTAVNMSASSLSGRYQQLGQTSGAQTVHFRILATITSFGTIGAHLTLPTNAVDGWVGVATNKTQVYPVTSDATDQNHLIFQGSPAPGTYLISGTYQVI